MYDDRIFEHAYDLYRPTLDTTASGMQRWAEPAEPTSTGNRCLFFDGALSGPGGVSGMINVDEGMVRDFDAVMLIPAGDTLRPEKEGESPDHVYVSHVLRMFIARSVIDAASRGLFKVVGLTERA